MTNKPGNDNHYILCADGRMFNLLDVLIYNDPIEDVINKIISEHGEIIKANSSPLKIFEAINGLSKDGKFMPIGATNWNNLFMIRDQFEGYYAYIYKQGEKKLVATSKEGLFWNYDIIDA
jgi:hypothetical protein